MIEGRGAILIHCQCDASLNRTTAAQSRLSDFSDHFPPRQPDTRLTSWNEIEEREKPRKIKIPNSHLVVCRLQKSFCSVEHTELPNHCLR